MPVSPVLMVLYSNDSVEVRYSDKTRIQLSPCGSTLIHFDNPEAGTHPLHGATKVQQRVQFVTSNHKQKVIQALDFRNRFAEKPFICTELTPISDIHSLYTDIQDVKWPASLEKVTKEILSDGSIRLMAADDFASLVLSPNGHDFTVCYLSKVSEEIKPTKSKISQVMVRAKTEFKNNFSYNSIDVFDGPQHYPRCFTPPVSDFIINNGSSPELKIDPIYTQRVSTPTKHKVVSINETPIITPFGSTAVLKLHNHKDNSPGADVHDLSSISKISSDGLNATLETVDVTISPKESQNQFFSNHEQCIKSGNVKTYDESKGSSTIKYRYTWITKHYSCSQCPLIWNHPLKLAKQILEDQKNSKSPQNNEKGASSGNSCKEVKSGLPKPQPLTCPSQHLHRWSTGHGKEFQCGRLSVVMAEGVIFRLIHLPSITSIEIYPGDGSVIYSHGVSGQYYQHILVQKGKIEERSYSLKSLPPSLPNSKYSIEKVIRRGSRFLMEAIEANKHTRQEEIPCWKHDDIGPMVPITCEVLEECEVQGRGKFTAYTNGRVRIIFEDRTALDMICDFSSKLPKYSQVNEGEREQPGTMPRITGFDRLLGRESCRLLLPNSQYILVDITKPGIYDHYVRAAKEWARWVNSHPNDRQHFYEKKQEDVDPQYWVKSELKKINCFNYIVDNTVLQKNMCMTTNKSNSYVNAAYPVDSGYVSQSRNNSTSIHDIYRASREKETEINDGFNSVRQALLKTSKLINDIDDILDKSK